MTLVDLDKINLREICPNPYPWENDDSAYEDLEDFLYSQPVVDAKPIIHAHWIDTDEYYEGAFELLYYSKCSHCKEKSLLPAYYCPWCGACMDEKDEEE